MLEGPVIRPSIALLGCGKMGQALLQGWIEAEQFRAVTIIDPHTPPDFFLKHETITHKTSIEDLDTDVDVVFIAVKPQILSDLYPSLQNSTALKNSLFLSIAAGKTIAGFETALGNNRPIIRAMPNTPAAIGKGVTVAIGNNNVTPDQKNAAHTLLLAGGMVEWIDDETLMNAVTALSGSGPAYIFYLIEVMTKAGETLGLKKDLAAKLARQTVIGASALADIESKTSAEQLRINVTSPGGTTEAALKILMDGRMQELFEEALFSAKKRGIDLE